MNVDQIRKHALYILELTEPKVPEVIEFTWEQWEKFENYLNKGTLEPLVEGLKIPHFSDSEFNSRDPRGPKLPEKGVSISFKFLLEVLSTRINEEFPMANGKRRRIFITTAFGKNGGYRPGHPDYPTSHAPKHLHDFNRNCGGARASKHKVLDKYEKFCAADIHIEGDQPGTMMKAAKAEPVVQDVFRYGGVGISDDGYLIHVDYDSTGRERDWRY